MRGEPIRGFPRSVTIATPCYDGRTHVAFVQSMQRLQRVCDRRRIRLQWLTTSGVVVDIARESVAAGFLRTTGETLVFVDADIGFAVRTVLELVQLAGRLDFVGVAVPTKRISWAGVWRASQQLPEEAAAEVLPLVATTGRDLEPLDPTAPVDPSRPIEVAWIGTSMLAVHRRVFAQLAERHPELHYAQRDDAGSPAVAFFSPGVHAGVRDFEDGAFCRRWRAAGGRCWAIVWPTVQHVGALAMTDDLALRAHLGLPLSGV